MKTFTCKTMATACRPDAGWIVGLTATTKSGHIRPCRTPRRRKCTTRLIRMEPSRRRGTRCGRKPSRENVCEGQPLAGSHQSIRLSKRLAIRPPAAVRRETLKKRRGRTGSAKRRSFSLFESSLKRGKTQQTTITINDRRPEESILNYALRGLKNGVRLILRQPNAKTGVRLVNVA